MLAWAEVQSREGLEAGSAAQAGALGMHDLEAVNYVLFDGVKSIINDSLLGRARGCEERGLELWRARNGTAPRRSISTRRPAGSKTHLGAATCKASGPPSRCGSASAKR